ncbi:MAG: hypothetical protein F4237_07190 [Gemmatimonadetes bacterium]|nr:hypothetical protein [Gemmatimonadota bacterium]
MTDLKRCLTSGGRTAVRLMAILALGTSLACDELVEGLAQLDSAFSPMAGSPTGLFEDAAEDVFGDDVVIEPDPEQEGRFSLRLHRDAEGIDIDLSDLASWLEDGFAVLEEGMGEGVEFAGRAGEDGWDVRIGSQDTDAVVELVAHDDGASVSVSDDSRGVSVSLGDESEPLPRWVPNYRGTREDKRLFSYSSGDAVAGGVLLASDGDPDEILRWYEQELSRGGRVDVSSSAKRIGGSDEDVYAGWLVAEEDPETGSQVSVVVGKDGAGDTEILVVYKQKR